MDGQWLTAHQDTESDPARFPVYSLAKTVIATLALTLVDEGLLDLEEPVARWHPDVPGAERVSLRQLLGHRGGFRDYGGLPEYHAELAAHPREAWTREEYLKRTLHAGLLFEPGSAFAYSNPGYRLAREIVEQAAGQSIPELVEQRLAATAQLRHLKVLETRADYVALETARSTRLGGQGEARVVSDWMDPDWVFHGTFGATASDVVGLLAALADGRLLSEESRESMLRMESIGRGVPPWTEPSYGLGLMGDPATPLGPMWGHNGGGPGYTASGFHLPEHPSGAVTVCVLCASEEGDAAEKALRLIIQP